jgi:hypothetical protein
MIRHRALDSIAGTPGAIHAARLICMGSCWYLAE